ncbi:MAG: Single-stranded DNA-binding protein [Verrucomicrobiae bacterium]|nr:Single-stranded DNA-binding protein [Verrucomicrobiae bacterium]
MANFNKVMLMGNLTRDPEVRYTPKGTAIATIGMAVNRTWTTESGEKKEEVTFVDVDVWGKQAETIGQYMSKGKPIFIEGRLKLDSWDDKESGQKRSKLKVVCEAFQFIGAPKGNAEFSEKPPARTGGGSRPAPPARPAEEDVPQSGGGDDNIPF